MGGRALTWPSDSTHCHRPFPAQLVGDGRLQIDFAGTSSTHTPRSGPHPFDCAEAYNNYLWDLERGGTLARRPCRPAEVGVPRLQRLRDW